jgi:hypothetical protein
MKKFFFVVFLILFSILSLMSQSDKYRLCLRDNPSNSIVVAWNNIGGSQHRVYYDVVDYGQDTSAYAFMKYPDRVENVKGMNNTFARLSGLTPNTRYYFVVCNDNFISERMYFETIHDDPSIPLSIIFGGDSRSNQTNRQNANKMAAKLRSQAIVFGGDYVDDGTNSEWAQWFDDWQLTIAEDGRCTPIIATQGNHELIWTNFPSGNDVVDKLFDTPGGGDHYFTMDFGGNLLRIYSLDSEYPVATNFGAQTNWLANDLAQNADNFIWLAAQFHSPVRPHNADKVEGFKQYNEWVPLFDQYRFAFVHENDAHLCKQTWPIRKSNAAGSEEGFIRDDYNGIVYIGEGGWGAPLRNVDDSKNWTRDMAKVNQFKWIFVRQDTIEIRTVLTDSVNNVVPLQDGDDIFSMPQGISLWEPSNGSVIIIQKWSVPECNIISPENDTHYENPQPILISAEANDPYGIEKVDFYVNGEFVNSVYQEPYELLYELSYEGMYYLSAKAFNNQGVHSNMSPIVSIGCGDLTNNVSFNISDYAEERVSNGNVDTESGDLELIRESGWMGLNEYDQIVGVRFNDINIPQGAIIQNAYIQFKTDETNNDNPCNLLIKGELSPNASQFANSSNNVSNRTLTQASVSWTPADWTIDNEIGINQQTPDLSQIISEIVNQDDWQIFNSMAFVISGEGRRTANASNVVLNVEYTVNVLPQIELISPANQEVYTELISIPITAIASDFDGEISYVEFYINNQLTQIVNSSSSEFSFNYLIPAYQQYEVFAKAVDNNGGEAFSETKSFKATTPPFVELTSPASDTIVYGLPEINLSAFADDQYGSVVSVSFYTSANELIGIDYDYPYQQTWTVPYYGSFDLKAVATDDDGVTSESETVILTAEISTLINDSEKAPFSLHPNPVESVLNISIDDYYSREKTLVVVYNTESKVLLQQFIKPAFGNIIMIDFSNFPTGSYIIKLKNSQFNYSSILIKI